MESAPDEETVIRVRRELEAAAERLCSVATRMDPCEEDGGDLLRRDLAKFREEADLLRGEVPLWFPLPHGECGLSGERWKSARHDARNRLNHLFGTLQLVRIGAPPASVSESGEEALRCLEDCLSALSAGSTVETALLSETVAPAEAASWDPFQETGYLLIADDDAENREILRRLLEPQGFRLAFAENGAEAIEQMGREEFDAILLDIQMPEMDGFEVLSHLRKTGQLRNTPVIVVTGLQEEQDAVRCIENGAEDFLSRPIRPALLMARLNASLEKKRLRERVFEQHFTRELARELARNPDPMKMQARQAEVSVLFCDIRGFSAVSERLGPSQTIAWLGGVMGDFSTIVLDFGGVLVDYTGDEVLAMWGAPNEQPDHAELACRAALEILRSLPELNERWRPVVGAETEVGIGINSGEALVGNVGTHRKFKYGPLGTAVNLASRVQGANKFLKTSMLITGDTVAKVRKVFPARRLCQVRAQNIKMPVQLYELEAPGAYGNWKELSGKYENALRAFERGDFGESGGILEEFLEAVPEDGPGQLLLSRIRDAVGGDGADFDPIWTLPGK